jgi:ferredoxin
VSTDEGNAFARERPTRGMKVEYDYDTCIGMFQCVAEWDAFERDEDAGKAVLADSEETESDVFVREVPDDAELDAKFAARSCPVDAITIYDEDGEQLIP